MPDEDKSAKAESGLTTQLLLSVAAAVAIALLSMTHFYQDLESSSYDFRFRKRNDWFGKPTQLPSIATVDIDDLAYQTHGFPFTRDLHARMVETIYQYGARMIGFDMFFYEPSGEHLSPKAIASLDDDSFSREAVHGLIQDHDQDFVRAAKQTDIVYLSQTFEIAEGKTVDFAEQNQRQRTPEKDRAVDALSRFSVPMDREVAEQLFVATDIDVPILPYIESSRGIGFALPKPDHDGIVRHYRMAIYYDGRAYFSLSLGMACDYLKVPLEKVRFEPGQIVLPEAIFPDGRVSDLRIPVFGQCEIIVNWAGPFNGTYRHFPYNLIMDFAETEPQNRALKFAKRVLVESPDVFGDDTAFLARARKDNAQLPDDLLLENRNIVMDCAGMEEVLLADRSVSVEGFVQMMGVPEEDIAPIVEILGPYFNRIKNNLGIAEMLTENPTLSLGEVAERLGVSRLEDLDLGVGIIRSLVNAGGVQSHDHPLFFLDRIITGGLHGEQSSERILSGAEFDGTVFFYGLTATGTHDLNPTPFGAREAMLGAHVNVFNSILTQNFLKRLSPWQNIVVMIVLGILIGVLVPRYKALPGAAVVLAILATYLVGVLLLFVKAGIWADMLGPIATLAVGYLTITLYDYVQKEKEKEFVQGAFGHYLDPKVVDQLVDNPDLVTQLGGDQRVMTVFFSDIASFSSISENLTAVELVELLNEYLTEMCETIAIHEGTIDKFEGDSIMAFWGAPVPFEHHARAAVYACIDMQQKCSDLREKFEREGQMIELRQLWEDQGRGEFLRVRMGVNTGEMVVGNLGSATRVDYTVMGDAVNLASRLEGAGKAYGITTMISEFTHRAAGEIAEVRPLDVIRVVGKDEPVRVYEVLGKKGEVNQDKLDVVDAYLSGFTAYSERKWDEATAHFSAGLKIDPEDGPCQIFVDRCNGFKAAPPDDVWDAVHNLDSK